MIVLGQGTDSHEAQLILWLYYSNLEIYNSQRIIKKVNIFYFIQKLQLGI